MVWMTNFCFYCSVRLGVIVSAFICMAQSATALILFIVSGIDVLKSLIRVIQDDKEYSQQKLIKKLLRILDEQPQKFLVAIECILAIHITTCIAAAYGAIKLNKWFLVPHIITEFLRFVSLTTAHIISMIVLKKILNLGILIAATVIGGFILLLIGYMWITVISFFQIIQLVNSEKYKILYGDDPFQPLINNQQFRKIAVKSNPAEYTPPPEYNEVTSFHKGWNVLNKKSTLPTIHQIIDERQYRRDWYSNEFMQVRRTNFDKY